MTTRDHRPDRRSPAGPTRGPRTYDASRAFYGEAVRLGRRELPSRRGSAATSSSPATAFAPGGMGDMGYMKAANTWKIYLATDYAAKTVEHGASAAGATSSAGRCRSPIWARRPSSST